MQTPQSWKIYLDMCCLNRFFDPQIQGRIRRETEAVDTILTSGRGIKYEKRIWRKTRLIAAT